MDTQELFAEARKDYSTAMNLAGLVLMGDSKLSISQMLDSYAILKEWVVFFEKEVQKNDQETLASYEGLKEQFLSYISEYEERVFFEFEVEILLWFRSREICGFSEEDLKIAKVFADSMENNDDLATKNWKEFLPE